ncbi:hypothetical protein [Actinokineospora sp. NPDC004072]
MILRRVAAALAVLAAGAGCTGEAEPVPVAEDFKAVVTDLLRAVDGSAEPSFGAAACGAWPAVPDQVITWADAELTGVTADALRTAAIAAGWQPQATDAVDLALVGPHDVLLALTGTTVRAERPNCTKPTENRQLDHNDFERPDPTDAQARAVAEGQERARQAAAAVNGVLGRDGREVNTLPPTNCGGAGPRGLTWTVRDTAKLAADTDLEGELTRMADALTAAGWAARPTATGVGATSGDLALAITAKRPSSGDAEILFRLEVQPAACVPVTGP